MEITLAWTSVLYAYLTLHVLYGLVTHWHSALEVNRHNNSTDYARLQVKVENQLLFLFARLISGLPVLIGRVLWGYVVSPIVFLKKRPLEYWHLSPERMRSCVRDSSGI